MTAEQLKAEREASKQRQAQARAANERAHRRTPKQQFLSRPYGRRSRRDVLDREPDYLPPRPQP